MEQGENKGGTVSRDVPEAQCLLGSWGDAAHTHPWLTSVLKVSKYCELFQCIAMSKLKF